MVPRFWLSAMKVLLYPKSLKKFHIFKASSISLSHAEGSTHLREKAVFTLWEGEGSGDEMQIQRSRQARVRMCWAFKKPHKPTQTHVTGQGDTWKLLSWRAEWTGIRMGKMKEWKRPAVHGSCSRSSHCPPGPCGLPKTTRAWPCLYHLMAWWPWTSSRNDFHAPGLGAKEREWSKQPVHRGMQ